MEKVIIIIGSGCREYTIAKKLKEDVAKLVENSYKFICFTTQENGMMNNIVDVVYPYDGFNNPDSLFIEFIDCHKDIIDFVFIGPENPLADGIVDFLSFKNVKSFGPSKFFATIESSKIFCRNFMKINNLDIYSPNFLEIKYLDNILNLTEIEISKLSNFREANINYIDSNGRTIHIDRGHDISIRDKFNKFYQSEISNFGKVVIKKDGLCGGKGVIVQSVDFNDNQSKDTILKEIIGSYIHKYDLLIEQKLEGQEFSLNTFTDGYHYVHCPPIQDYKRLLNNDEGPNTGGMGCVAYENNTLPFLTNDDIYKCQHINQEIIERLNKYGKTNNYNTTYNGILYGSFIKTNDGNIKVIEYNSRLGDPETMIVMALLESNFYNLCKLVITSCLDIYTPVFKKDAAICLYYVPDKYPTVVLGVNKYNSYYDIYMNDIVEDEQITLAYGNCKRTGEHLYSMKSRTLSITTTQPTFYQAYHKIYQTCHKVVGKLHYRTDIGDKFLSRYQKSGVSIENAEESLKNIKQNILATYNNSVISEYGSFGGEYKLDDNNTLVASIDGVGSKSIASNSIYGIDGFRMLGQDIVGHSINDILVQGATPLFFLDYFGTACLNKKELEYFIEGVSSICVEYGNIPILGGETAEMPLVYRTNESDLIGCIIGVKDNNFFKSPMKSGNILINLPSVGPHTNGFTLINDLLIDKKLTDIDIEFIKSLLTPHKCYLNEVKQIIDIVGYDSITGMCHITGGGFYQNMSRVVPKDLQIELYHDIVFPKWCLELQNKLNISRDEMLQVYNCGLGYIVIIDEHKRQELNDLNIKFEIIGELK